jgi:serine/threonine protein kinase
MARWTEVYSSSDLDLGETIRGLTAGQRLFERYTLERILGRGGMGIVWLARDEKLEREVALKFLPELVVHDAGVLDDLKRETKRSLELTHHNIVRIYDFTHEAHRACISMEYVDGPTLSALRVERQKKFLEPEELLPLVIQICAALDYAHRIARTVHRDLKPANLMLNSKGELKVTDFGISQSLMDSMSILTAARSVSGTLVYMSPQQLDGERALPSDDIYSLGATLYELLTSRPPFYSGQIDRQIREKLPPPMSERREHLQLPGDLIPAHWEAVVAACLAKDSSRRPRSAGALADWLRNRRPNLEIVELPVSPKVTNEPTRTEAKSLTVDAGRRWNRRRAVIIALVLGVAGAAFVLIARQSMTRRDEQSVALATPAPTPHSSPSPSFSPSVFPQTAIAMIPARNTSYPPKGYIKDADTWMPDLVSRLEEWRQKTGFENTANPGRAPRQVWLVSERTKQTIQLPDFKIPRFPGSGPGGENITADIAGYSSSFSFSPDGTYLFRSQKLLLGVGGAYLYRRKEGLNYEVVMPDLFLRACEFFTQRTQVQWKEGLGIVELSAWGPNDTLVLVLRGLKKDRSPVLDWRCTFDPASRQFSEFSNTSALQQDSAVTTPTTAPRGPGFDKMKAPHAELLQKWLPTQSNLRLASISDYSKDLRSALLQNPHDHAFYFAGDFNKDRIEDFAVKLVRDGKSKEYYFAIFNGSSGPNPAFTKGGFAADDRLQWIDNKLSIGDGYGGHFYNIKPVGASYIAEEGTDE